MSTGSMRRFPAVAWMTPTRPIRDLAAEKLVLSEFYVF
jgi:hypothetical protein